LRLAGGVSVVGREPLALSETSARSALWRTSGFSGIEFTRRYWCAARKTDVKLTYALGNNSTEGGNCTTFGWVTIGQSSNMASRLANLKITPRKRHQETDPEKIFQSLTLRGGIENIWEPQAEALRHWHKTRGAPRVVLEMNTGGGKTLIAMLIAQSLVNETTEHVLYVCSTNQLVEQTRQQAAQCGLETSTYYGGTWHDEPVYRQGRGPCITNYAALFNGKSIFRKDVPAAIIMDDAHVAGPNIRAAFTLKIAFGTPLFAKLAGLYQQYFKNAGHEHAFISLIGGDPIPLFFVPAFQVNRSAQKLSTLLVEGGVGEDKATLFAWEHLRDHIDRCVVLFSAKRIEIGPVMPPLESLPQLSQCPRVVYMTATLPSAVQFTRIFGPRKLQHIKPGGKSGEAQRLFVFAEGDTDEDQRKWAKALIKSKKACVLTASTDSASQWASVGSVYAGEQGQAGLDAFKGASPPEKIIMASRYDGIDLPGDCCRILVIDGLPLGAFLLDRFADETLHIEGLRASSTAVRVTQAVGRIFRSNTDHGVVVLCGRDLQRWISTPKNQAFLPGLLQRQVQFSLELKEKVASGQVNHEELISGVLKGRKDWDTLYNDSIGDYDTRNQPQPDPWLVAAAGEENEAFEAFWSGAYDKAGPKLTDLAELAEPHDAGLAGWYRHWAGLAQERLGKPAEAFELYRMAANARAQLGRPKQENQAGMSADIISPGAQAEAIASGSMNFQKVLKRLEIIRTNLVYGEDTKPAEAAISDLGTLLGLTASRPDNDEKPRTGPDVLWRSVPDKSGIALEAKTDKKSHAMYQKKDDIAQFHDHVGYLNKKYGKENFVLAIVGRELPVSPECHPPVNLRIIPIEGFQELADRVRRLYEYIDAASDTDTPAVKAQRWLGYLGLAWPSCIEALHYSFASDLQRPERTNDVTS
jgi:hypothetical protein